MGKGGGGGGGTQTTKSEPWEGVQDYLTGKGSTYVKGTRTLKAGAQPTGWKQEWSGTGGDAGGSYQNVPIYDDSAYETTPGYWTGGTPGIYGEAARLYGQGGLNSAEQGLNSQWYSALVNRGDLPMEFVNNIANTGNSLLSGAGSQVDLAAARAGQGALDPTAALQQLLTGQVNNPYLDEQISALGKDLSSNFLENVAPGMRSGAVAAGGFGGSRQGIVEGLGAQGVSDALATSAANLRGTAFENAQNRMQQVATGLNDQAATVAQNNINNRLNYANMGSNLIGQGQAMMTARDAAQDQRFAQMQALLGANRAADWANLGNYASIISPGAGIGGTSTLLGGGSNPVAGAAGGALAGAGLAGALGTSTPWGAAIGGGLGLLGAL